MRHPWFVGVLLLAMIVATAAAAEKSKISQGKVTAVTADSITISTGAESMTFAVDAATTVRGKGLKTKSNEMAAKGEKITLADSLGVNDVVSVTYTEAGGKAHASLVKIVQKGFGTAK
jgi:hypothetical protein